MSARRQWGRQVCQSRRWKKKVDETRVSNGSAKRTMPKIRVLGSCTSAPCTCLSRGRGWRLNQSQPDLTVAFLVQRKTEEEQRVRIYVMFQCSCCALAARKRLHSSGPNRPRECCRMPFFLVEKLTSENRFRVCAIDMRQLFRVHLLQLNEITLEKVKFDVGNLTETRPQMHAPNNTGTYRCTTSCPHEMAKRTNVYRLPNPLPLPTMRQRRPTS